MDPADIPGKPAARTLHITETIMSIYQNNILSGQTAVVTGASRGIGLAIATALAECGADIAVVDYCDESLSGKAAAEIAEKAGVTAKAYRCDVSSFDEAAETVVRLTEGGAS